MAVEAEEEAVTVVVIIISRSREGVLGKVGRRGGNNGHDNLIAMLNRVLGGVRQWDPPGLVVPVRGRAAQEERGRVLRVRISGCKVGLPAVRILLLLDRFSFNLRDLHLNLSPVLDLFLNLVYSSFLYADNNRERERIRDLKLALLLLSAELTGRISFILVVNIPVTWLHLGN